MACPRSQAMSSGAGTATQACAIQSSSKGDEGVLRDHAAKRGREIPRCKGLETKGLRELSIY